MVFSKIQANVIGDKGFAQLQIANLFIQSFETQHLFRPKFDHQLWTSQLDSKLGTKLPKVWNLKLPGHPKSSFQTSKFRFRCGSVSQSLELVSFDAQLGRLFYTASWCRFVMFSRNDFRKLISSKNWTKHFFRTKRTFKLIRPKNRSLDDVTEMPLIDYDNHSMIRNWRTDARSGASKSASILDSLMDGSTVELSPRLGIQNVGNQLGCKLEFLMKSRWKVQQESFWNTFTLNIQGSIFELSI